MKKSNRSKIILGLAAVLAGTAAVGVTSTMAWFTTQNTANISFATAHVVSDNASIKIQYYPVANSHVTGATTSSTGGSINIGSTAINCRDISGDGKNFYRPHWTVWNTTADTIDAKPNDADTTYYVTFGFSVTNIGVANTYVLINTTSALAGGTHAVPASRVSLWKGAVDGTNMAYDSAATSPVTVWQPKTQTADYKYIEHKTGTCYGKTDYSLTGLTQDTGVFHAGPYNTSTQATAVAGQSICTLAAQNSVSYFVCTLWIEGTNTAATDDCIGEDVTMNLNLLAVTA